MECVQVTTKDQNYNVLIGTEMLAEAWTLCDNKVKQADRIFVFTDQSVWAAQQSYFEKNFDYPFDVFIFPGGESSKTFEQYELAQTFLLQQNATRQSLIIAFGGGAIGDVAGFVAATYMRGIPFIQVPTTILAHDSAVGGKTAINHSLGKNMIGAFYQPQAVIYDTHLLKTLPTREVRSGMAEVVKHAYLSDEQWLATLLHESQQITPSLNHHLKRGIEVKAAIVSQDETEQSVRKYLNLGHTYGHAVEAAAGYGKLAHGEAIMIGLVFTLLLSETYGDISHEDTLQFVQYALRNDYPLDAIHDYPFDQLANYLMKDKKVEYGELKFVLLKVIGQPIVQTITLEECRIVDAKLRAIIREAAL